MSLRDTLKVVTATPKRRIYRKITRIVMKKMKSMKKINSRLILRLKLIFI